MSFNWMGFSLSFLLFGVLLHLVSTPKGRLILLGILYLHMFVVVSFLWGWVLGGVKLIGGLASCILLWTRASRPGTTDNTYFSYRLFVVMTLVFSFLLLFSLFPEISILFSFIPRDYLLSGSISLVVGIIGLAFSRDVFNVLVYLYTVLIGFEIIYASLEVSTLMAGLMALVHLGLAIIGLYVLETELGVEAK